MNPKYNIYMQYIYSLDYYIHTPSNPPTFASTRRIPKKCVVFTVMYEVGIVFHIVVKAVFFRVGTRAL